MSVKDIAEPMPAHKVLPERTGPGERRAQSQKPRPGTWQRSNLIAAAIIGVLVALGAIWCFHPAPPPGKAALEETPALKLPEKPSVAVLAFDDLSGDPKQEYFSDGLAEEIVTGLSKMPHLSVIARNPSFAFKGKAPFFRSSFVIMGEIGESSTAPEMEVLQDEPLSIPPRKQASQKLTDRALGESLLIACKSGRIRDAAELIERAANVHHRDPEFGGTSLHWASYGGYLKVVALLLKKGADVNARNKGGRTPLMFAAGMGHLNVVELLLRSGADSGLKDEQGRTALDWASARNQRVVAAFLNGTW